jgi:Arc/MetJ family transcription regulator
MCLHTFCLNIHISDNLTQAIRSSKMRTNIVIDDALMEQAMQASGLKSKRATVEAALRLLIQIKAQTGIRRLRGKVKWEGDLDTMRADRVREP